jgi:Spy/CpxP family protein refolding chaperone
MQRGKWLALAAVLAAVLAIGGMAIAESDDYIRGFGWGRGPGMMGGGYGPGMMGGGYGPGMMGFGGPAFWNLPADKQDQLRKLHVSAGQAMVALMADMEAKGAALREAVSKFPIDEAAAKKAHDAMGKLRDQMFELRLKTLAQAQQIVGKEAWEEWHSAGWGPGYGQGRGPGMMGPGPRGPNR